MSGAKPVRAAPVIPQLYLHCRACVEEKLAPNIEAFVDVKGELFVWCRNHDAKVFRTQVSVMDVSRMECEGCRQGVKHAH